MQLAYAQSIYDIMIPIYFGNSRSQFNQSNCGVILIQVKNGNDAITVKEIFKETFMKVTPG